ncbi:MAG: shikimate kinase [Planctomycetota bacterium]
MDADALLTQLGRTLRERRAARSWSRRELAEKSGVSERFLADVESGRGNLSVRKLALIATALDTTPAVLLEPASLQALGARSISLLGLRGAGKSTVGRLLAEQLGRRFVELDREIERTTGLRVGQIFELNGERYFREAERGVLRRLLDDSDQPLVIATGGGLVTDRETYELLRARTATVWLRARPEDHWRRVVAQGDTRPMDGQEQAFDALCRILIEREPAYALAALTIDTTDREPEILADDIARRFGDRATPKPTAPTPG